MADGFSRGCQFLRRSAGVGSAGGHLLQGGIQFFDRAIQRIGHSSHFVLGAHIEQNGQVSVRDALQHGHGLPQRNGEAASDDDAQNHTQHQRDNSRAEHQCARSLIRLIICLELVFR